MAHLDGFSVAVGVLLGLSVCWAIDKTKEVVFAWSMRGCEIEPPVQEGEHGQHD